MMLTCMVGNFISGFVNCYHEKSGNMSSRDMSGLMIHHSRNCRAVEWPKALEFQRYPSIGRISSRCGICFYRFLSSHASIKALFNVQMKRRVKLENRLDWFGYKTNVRRKHAPSGWCWNWSPSSETNSNVATHFIQERFYFTPLPIEHDTFPYMSTWLIKLVTKS